MRCWDSRSFHCTATLSNDGSIVVTPARKGTASVIGDDTGVSRRGSNASDVLSAVGGSVSKRDGGIRESASVIAPLDTEPNVVNITLRRAKDLLPLNDGTRCNCVMMQ